MASRYLNKPRRPAPTQSGKREREPGNASQPSAAPLDNVKGEGNYKAAREFDEAERKFVQSEKLDQGIRNVAPKSETEQREMEDAEEQARRRAKEEDPALLRKPTSGRQSQR